MDDFVNTFTNVVDRCFRQCANDFTTKAVTGREVGG
jgi:import inner membrane translocase subunit TIM9